MATKQCAECTELEPPQIEFRGEFLGGHKAADVGAPEGDSGKRRIDGNRDLSPQSLPSRIDIARPKKRAISLHAGVSVTMQGERALIGTVHLRPLPVQAVACQSRWDIERMALIGPPAVDPHGEGPAMCIPVATGALVVKARYITRITNRTV